MELSLHCLTLPTSLVDTGHVAYLIESKRRDLTDSGLEVERVEVRTLDNSFFQIRFFYRWPTSLTC